MSLILFYMIIRNTMRCRETWKKYFWREAVLQRLVQLTRTEAQTAATETLKFIYGLVKNSCASITRLFFALYQSSHFHLRGSILIDDVHRILGMLYSWVTLSRLTGMIVPVQQLESDISKSRRTSNYCCASAANDG